LRGWSEIEARFVDGDKASSFVLAISENARQAGISPETARHVRMQLKQAADAMAPGSDTEDAETEQPARCCACWRRTA
jgi:hypothetical protein